MGYEMYSSRVQDKMTIKSNFARTCNRFSQFLKERRSFGDLDDVFTTIASSNFEAKGDINAYSTQIQTKSNDAHRETEVNKSLDLFPLTSEPKKSNMANMTIIYDGEVLIFEDLQEEMAQEILSLASQNTQQNASKSNNNTITTHALFDLPIARRVSLHRFMEKRKHRIAACAPYQPKNSSTTKELYNKQQEEQHLELKL